jgi:tetratricopeptide (TPR) repeat protein
MIKPWKICMLVAAILLYLDTPATPNVQIDSLLREVKKAKTNKELATLYNHLAHKYNKIDLEESIRYGKLGLDHAQKGKETEKEAYAYYILAKSNISLYHYQQAIDYLIPALEHYTNLADSVYLQRCNYYLGICYFDMGQHNDGLKYLLAAAEVAKKQQYTLYLAGTYNEIGSLLSEMGKHEKAIEYQLKALEIRLEIGDSSGTADSYNNLSTTYINLKDYDKALEYQQLAIDGWTAAGQTQRSIYGNTNMGLIYSRKDDYEKAFTYFQTALKDARPEDILILERIHNLYGTALYGNNQLNLAIEHFHAAAQYAKAAESKVATHQNYEMLAAVFKRKGKLDSAFHYLSLFSGLRDSILSENMAQKAIEMEAAYSAKERKQELLLKEKEIAMAKNEKKLAVFRRNVILLVCTLIVIVAILLFRKERNAKRRNKRLHEAEFKIEELKRENLERDVHFKNKQLITYALQLTQKNDMLVEIQNRLKKIGEIVGDETFLTKINQLNHFINSVASTDDEWEEFKLYYEQVHLQFFKKMKDGHPELSNKELRLCALLNISLATKEIASILHISPKSVEIARYRLRKKLGISREENLTEYINKRTY